MMTARRLYRCQQLHLHLHHQRLRHLLHHLPLALRRLRYGRLLHRSTRISDTMMWLPDGETTSRERLQLLLRPPLRSLLLHLLLLQLSRLRLPLKLVRGASQAMIMSGSRRLLLGGEMTHLWRPWPLDPAGGAILLQL